MSSYVPSTKDEKQQMLEVVGVKSYDELFADVPSEVFLKERLDLPVPLSELEVSRMMEAMAARNKIYGTILRGAGSYYHYIPSAVKEITSKEEFVTAYTPYQAEISQGILQSIFEYQTMICELTGMDVSNASVYDGAEAAAEAVAMTKERKRVKAYISATSNPEYIETVKTYCFASDTELTVVPEKDGKTDLEAVKQLMGDDAACLYVQSPNFYGIFEDVEAVAEAVHAVGAKLIMGCNPIALGIMKTPRELGADIAVGEGQPLGMSMSFGGPYLGFMATTTALTRKLPGRIVGETVDSKGDRAFVLTLQAREQHIRREKASSNICSNEALCALTAGVYMTVMGPKGLAQAANLCLSKAHYFASQLAAIDGVELKYSGEFFHEFVTEMPASSNKIVAALDAADILAGLPLEDGSILWCVTEMCTKEELDKAVEIIKEVCC